ncbi:MAG: hypothetical protein ACOC9J_01460, partial [Persicimonas sp.]
DIETIGVDTDDDGTPDHLFTVASSLFEEGDIANLYVFGDSSTVRLLVQPLDSGADTVELLNPPSYVESFEGGSLPGDFTTGGDADWIIDTTDASDGSYSAQSGSVDHSEQTWMEFTYDFPSSGVLQFDWKVSSESASYDYLAYCLDEPDCGFDYVSYTSTYDERIGGTGDGWETVSVDIEDAGTHTIHWFFRRDSSGGGGDDMGWVDNIRFVED